jgi:hypothetical protein
MNYPGVAEASWASRLAELAAELAGASREAYEKMFGLLRSIMAGESSL